MLPTSHASFEAIEVPEIIGAVPRQRVEELLTSLIERLPWLSGDRHGEVWETAEELGTLGDDAAVAVPRLLAALAALTGTDADLERDVLVHATGSLLGSEVGDDALAEVAARLTDETLAALLRRRRPRRGRRIAEPTVAALTARWPEASLALKTGILGVLTGSGTEAPHASFAALAEDAVQTVLADPLDRHAIDLAHTAIDPYRLRALAQGVEPSPVHVAPPSLVERLPALALALDELYLRLSVMDTMVVQRDTERVSELLADDSSPLCFIAALVLAREPSFRARASETLRAVGGDVTRTEGERFEAVSHLDDPLERCAAYLELGLSGWGGAATQLGFLAREARGEALAALERLAKEAPDAGLRRGARNALTRLRKPPP